LFMRNRIETINFGAPPQFSFRFLEQVMSSALHIKTNNYSLSRKHIPKPQHIVNYGKTPYVEY
jgi:hypothetical protein